MTMVSRNWWLKEEIIYVVFLVRLYIKWFVANKQRNRIRVIRIFSSFKPERNGMLVALCGEVPSSDVTSAVTSQALMSHVATSGSLQTSFCSNLT